MPPQHLSVGERSFPLHHKGPNTGTHSQALHRTLETLEHTALIGMSSSNPSTEGLGNLGEEEIERIQEQRGWRTPEGKEPLNQCEQSPFELTEIEVATRGPARVCPRDSMCILWHPNYCFHGIPECEVGVGIWFLYLLLGSFPSVGLSFPNLTW